MAKLTGKAKAAFLRRMAKGRNKKHHTRHKRKKHHKSEGHVAKKRRHHKHKKSTRRRHHTSMGGLGKYVPPSSDLIKIATGYGYGKVEGIASKDAQHFLNKVPAVVPQIGRAGNLGALLWLAGVVTRHQVVKSVATGVLTVAGYQNGRGAGFTKDSPDFKMSGPGRRRDEILVEQYLQSHRGQ